MQFAQYVQSALLAAFALAPLVAAAEDATPQDDPVESRLANLPPLIEREVFFGDPEISGTQISPDGKWITFRKPYNDVVNIWVKAVNAPFDAARPITADTERPVGGYFWSEDSRYVLYVQDKGGNENYHVYVVDPAGEVNEATGAPDARDLTPIEGVRALIYAVPEATPNRILVGINDRDPALHDVYSLDLDTGERELLIENLSNIAGWVTDLSGEVRLAGRQRPDGGYETLVVEDGNLGRVLYECSFEENCGPVRFHKDGKRVYMRSNKGVDLSRLLLVDVESGDVETIESDPEGEVDFGGAWFSDVTEELVATVYTGDRVRIYPRTEALERELQWLRTELPDGEISYQSGTEDESAQIVVVGSDINPGAVYLYDRNQRTLDKLYDSRPELPSDHLAPMQAIRYKARDGEEIPGYLVTPKGVAAENLPTVILPHGGPWGRDYWGYNPWVQFLANRGYAVMQPNFRASTGYGKAFLNAGNGEWGTGIMQHDITDAVKYLVDEGIADPEQVAIMGASYGGYATLAGVAFTPDLYAAGVSIVGPSNIITLLNSIPPYWGPTKQMFMRRVGDPDDEADRARLTAQSPFFHAENIEAPLLIIQGANDPRVKKAESDQIVVALRDLDRAVQYLLAPDEGHGFAGKENRLAMFAAIERFLARHLDGRYQRQSAPEVSARLRALRVDIDEVEMPSADDGDFVEVALDGSALEPATLTYRITMEMAGQSMAMDTSVERSRTTHNDKEVWRVATTVESPMGQASDIAFLRVDDLRPVHRAIDQGPLSMKLDFSDDAITGAVTLPGGNTMDVDMSFEGAVLGHMESALAVMPLEPGFKTRVQAFEPGMQQLQQINIEVVAAESVETPAGAFDAYRLDVLSADGNGISGKSWVTRAKPHLAVKSEATLPPMAGGGTMVTELISAE